MNANTTDATGTTGYVNTRTNGVRYPATLETEAREHSGLTDVDFSVLARAGLALLAGYGLAEAIRVAKTTGRPGPKPRAAAGK